VNSTKPPPVFNDYHTVETAKRLNLSIEEFDKLLKAGDCEAIKQREITKIIHFHRLYGSNPTSLRRYFRSI